MKKSSDFPSNPASQNEQEALNSATAKGSQVSKDSQVISTDFTGIKHTALDATSGKALRNAAIDTADSPVALIDEHTEEPLALPCNFLSPKGITITGAARADLTFFLAKLEILEDLRSKDQRKIVVLAKFVKTLNDPLWEDFLVDVCKNGPLLFPMMKPLAIYFTGIGSFRGVEAVLTRLALNMGFIRKDFKPHVDEILDILTRPDPKQTCYIVLELALSLSGIDFDTFKCMLDEALIRVEPNWSPHQSFHPSTTMESDTLEMEKDPKENKPAAYLSHIIASQKNAERFSLKARAILALFRLDPGKALEFLFDEGILGANNFVKISDVPVAKELLKKMAELSPEKLDMFLIIVLKHLHPEMTALSGIAITSKALRMFIGGHSNPQVIRLPRYLKSRLELMVANGDSPLRWLAIDALSKVGEMTIKGDIEKSFEGNPEYLCFQEALAAHDLAKLLPIEDEMVFKNYVVELLALLRLSDNPQEISFYLPLVMDLWVARDLVNLSERMTPYVTKHTLPTREILAKQTLWEAHPLSGSVLEDLIEKALTQLVYNGHFQLIGKIFFEWLSDSSKSAKYRESGVLELFIRLEELNNSRERVN